MLWKSGGAAAGDEPIRTPEISTMIALLTTTTTVGSKAAPSNGDGLERTSC